MIMRYLTAIIVLPNIFARWYVAVLRFVIIGRIGKFSMPSLSERFWILAVLYGFPWDGPVGYICLYSLIENFDLILRNALYLPLICFCWIMFRFLELFRIE